MDEENNLKDFKEQEIKKALESIKLTLLKYGVKNGQIRVQIEDSESSFFTRGNNITETEPVIVSTGSGIMLCAKLDF